MASSPHPDPWRDVDAQPDAAQLAKSLELRGATRTQQRLRRRFLRFVPIRAGDGVLEVGCGTGVVIRDLAALVGRRGSVVGVDPSRLILGEARRLCRGATGGRDRKSTRLNSSHSQISYAVFCLKKKKNIENGTR